MCVQFNEQTVKSKAGVTLSLGVLLRGIMQQSEQVPRSQRESSLLKGDSTAAKKETTFPFMLNLKSSSFL